ncbi:MAG: HEAT repeat domain-containing protein [Ktedonobacteraceae bacterium]|nr:HEAT repeat domain-containing protein [Ktedonobacteraceae bacterium]
MPRRRKGPPQQSVDSILLAISRREDIDPATLSHYFARLDEEWTNGAREKVLHLLRTKDTTAQTAAVLILSELATNADLETLEDFVADPTVSDQAKLILSSTLKDLGSEMTDEGIIEYLNEPAAAMQQMQLRLLEMVERSETGAESILADVASMPVEKRLGFIYWLAQSNDPRATRLLIPMLENQAGKVVTAVIDALEQLGPVAARQAIPALNYIISTSSNRSLKQYARAALGRLTMQSMPGVEDIAMEEARQQQLPCYEARVSFIDGSGSQLILLSWQRPDGLLKGVNILFQDQWGIKDCYGIDEMDRQHWKALISELNEQGFGSFQAPFEFVRTLVMEARAFNKRTRHKVPIAYSIWRPFIEGDMPAKAKGATLAEPTILDTQTLTLAQRGHELYQMAEFASWLYDPLFKLEAYINRYMEKTSALIRMARGRNHTRKASEKERRMFLDELASEAAHDLIDDQWRALYTLRLRRQAALFKTAGRTETASIMDAVATVLHPASHIPIEEQSFVRTLLSTSIEQGPLRMLAESFHQSNFHPVPINIFDLEEE